MTLPRRMGGRVNLPVPTANVPRRWNALARAFALVSLRLIGWRFAGEGFPDRKKFVVIVAPHTSNWDFPIGVLAMFALNLRVAFLGKDTLFKFPLGILMRFLGGSPVDRSSPKDVVTQTVDLVNRSDKICIALSPEGTRKLTPRWRSGFYWIAQRAGIPIVPVAFDYPKREIQVFPLFEPTGDMDRDIDFLRSYFRPEMAFKPAQYVP